MPRHPLHTFLAEATYAGRELTEEELEELHLEPAEANLGHDLRHTGLTHEAAAGNPQAYVQLKAGHSRGSMTERYIHAAQVLVPGTAARAEERMFGATEGA